MQAVNLPVPYMGLNTKYPLAMLKAPYAEGVINFNPINDGLVLRNGDSFYKTGNGANDNLDIVTIDDDNLVALSFDAAGLIYFRDVLANTLLFTSTTVGVGVYPNINPSFFHRYTFFWGCDAVRSDAGVWGTIGYTGLGATGKGAVPYKNRNYIINKDSTKYNYSEINAIAGFTHEVDLKDVSTTGANIACVTRITISDNVSTVDLLSFILFSGEVLFFSGTYPDSSTWAIVGRATIGKPLSYMSGIAYGADFIAFCTTGPTSLRDVFLKGDKYQAKGALGEEIFGLWKNILAVYSSSDSYPMKGVWDKRNNRVVIFFPGFYNTPDWIPSSYNGGTYFLIYDTDLNCWYLHFTTPTPGDSGSYFSTKGLAIFRDELYYLTDNTASFPGYEWIVMKKEGATDYDDQDPNAEGRSIPGYILSAPIVLNESQIQKCEGVEMIMENGFSSSVSVKIVGNLGQTETAAQSVIGTTSGIQSQYFNAGIESLLIQYELTSASVEDVSVGLNLYTVALWLSRGTSPR